jgi:hypothetical protein
MARIATFPLALIISLALFAGAVAGVDWVMGHASYVHLFAGRGAGISIAETTSIFMGVWLPLFFSDTFSQKKKEEEEPGCLTPLVRRDPVTGLREL